MNLINIHNKLHLEGEYQAITDSFNQNSPQASTVDRVKKRKKDSSRNTKQKKKEKVSKANDK